jgi:putative transposase
MWIVRTPAPGQVHHVIIEILDREFLIADQIARDQYLRLLGRAMSESDWLCLAYAIMSNHIHLAMLAGESLAERWMRRVHPPYATWLNRRLHRRGRVFAGSPDIWVVHPDREGPLLAYIHNNPVRAGVVAAARDSAWTSHCAYLGENAPPWLATSVGLARAGLAVDAFDAYVAGQIGSRQERGDQAAMRRAARKLGSLEIGTPLDADPPTTPLLRRRYAHLKPTSLRVVEVTAEVVGVKVESLWRKPIDVRAQRVRALALYCGRTLGVSISSISAVLGLSGGYGSRIALRPLDDVDLAAAAAIVDRIDQESMAYVRAGEGGSR